MKGKALISTLIIVLFVTGLVIKTNLDQNFLTQWCSWTDANTKTKTPTDGLPEVRNTLKPSTPPTLPDPQPSPDPHPKPQSNHEPDPAPTSPDQGGSSDTAPVIYVGQKLIIPVKGYVHTDKSQLIQSGLVNVDQKQIALTFDAGWLYDQTEALLDVLDNYGLKCTFFTRGLWVQSNPQLAKEIVSRGHFLESHSLTHGHLINMSELEIRNELQKTSEIIEKTTGRAPQLYRPPFGEYNDQMLRILAEEGYNYTIMWTVDSHDWAEEIGGQQVTTDYLVKRVLNNATNNGIVLMHVGGFKTVEALPQIITGLQEKGFKLTTVNEMLPPSVQGHVPYTVAKGATLFSIAKHYKVTVQQIILANGL